MIRSCEVHRDPLFHCTQEVGISVIREYFPETQLLSFVTSVEPRYRRPDSTLHPGILYFVHAGQSHIYTWVHAFQLFNHIFDFLSKDRSVTRPGDPAFVHSNIEITVNK